MRKFYDYILLLIKTNIKTILECDHAAGHMTMIYVEALNKINKKQYFKGGNK